MPLFFFMDFIAENSSDGVMPFLENIRRDFQGFSDNAFDRVSSPVEFRFDLLNDDRLLGFGKFRHERLHDDSLEKEDSTCGTDSILYFYLDCADSAI
jgi:hypothetical protein